MGRNLLEEAGIDYRPKKRNLLEEAGIDYQKPEAANDEMSDESNTEQRYIPRNKQELGQLLRTFYQNQHASTSNEPTSALGAGLRAAGRLPYSLAEKIGVPHDALVYPDFLKETEFDRLQHPFAEFFGEAAVPGLGILNRYLKAGKGIEAVSKLRDITKLKDLIQKGQEAQIAHEEAQKETQGVKDVYGKSTIPSIKRALDAALNKKFELEEQNPNQQPLSEQEPVNLKNRLPGGTGEGLIPQAQQQTQQALAQTRQYLGAGQQNDVMFQRIMNGLIKGARSSIGQGYDALEDRFANKKVTIPNDRTLNEIHQELFRLDSQGKSNSPEANKLLDQLESHGKNETIAADEVLRQFRTVDKLAKLTFKKAFSRNENLTEEQRTNLENQAHGYQEQATKLQQLLEEHVDPEFADVLKDLNSQWRQYASLYRNPTGREIEAGRGIAGRNIFQKVRGDEPGQQLLRRIIASSPAASRAAIGHTYGENPEELLSAPEHEQEFIRRDPELSNYIDKIKQSLQREQQAQDITQQRQTEAKRVEEAFKEDVKLEQLKSQASEVAAEIEKLNKGIADLEQAIKKENLTYKEKLAIGERIKQANQIRQGLKTLGSRIVKSLLVLGGVDSLVKHLFNIFK